MSVIQDTIHQNPVVQMGVGTGIVGASNVAETCIAIPSVSNQDIHFITQIFEWGHFAELASMFGTAWIIYNFGKVIHKGCGWFKRKVKGTSDV